MSVSDQFRKTIIRHKRIGYSLNVMRQSASLVINPITVDNFASLFNCTPVDRESDSMMARPKAIHFIYNRVLGEARIIKIITTIIIIILAGTSLVSNWFSFS